MKVFFVFFTLAVAACVATITQADKDRVKKIHEDCQANPATNVDENLLKKLIHGEKVTVPNLGPHTLCMSKGAGLQKDNGDVDVEVLKQKVAKHVTDSSKVDVIVNECKEQKATPEDTAKHLFKCLHAHAIEAGLHDEHHHEGHEAHEGHDDEHHQH